MTWTTITTITFETKDEVLGTIIRALAIKAAGKEIALGLTDSVLRHDGFYRFAFNQAEEEQFKGLVVATYVSEPCQRSLIISSDSNFRPRPSPQRSR
jgi:hypothetical protein